MQTVVLQPSNEQEMNLLIEFLQRTPIKNKILSEEDKEDFVLGLMMQETDYNDSIDTAEFINRLQRK